MKKTAQIKAIDKSVVLKGTQFDRKRKLTDEQVQEIRCLLMIGAETVQSLAERYHVTPFTIKYNTDAEFRKHAISVRSGKIYGNIVCDIYNRVKYKEQLLNSAEYRDYIGVGK